MVYGRPSPTQYLLSLANHDFNELIQPALSGLADEDVTVIVAAGRSDTHTLAVPKNARVESFIPLTGSYPKSMC